MHYLENPQSLNKHMLLMIEDFTNNASLILQYMFIGSCKPYIDIDQAIFAERFNSNLAQA